MFPLLALLLARLSQRRLLWTGATCWVASMSLAALYVWRRPDAGAVANAALDATWINGVRFNPLTHLPEFTLGMTVGVLFLRRAPSAAQVRGIVPAVCVAIVLLLLVGRHIPYPMVHNGVLGPVIALLLCGLAADEGLLQRALASPFMQLLGGASFALYVLHVPLLVWFKKGTAFLGGDMSTSWWLPIAYVLASVLLAIGVFEYVEEPDASLDPSG